MAKNKNTAKSQKNKAPKLPLPPRSYLKYWLCLLLIALCGLAYANSFYVPFHFDDQVNISDNPYIRFQGPLSQRIQMAAIQDKNQNRPFSNMTFALDYQLYGNSAWGYHILNLLLHTTAVLAVYALLLATFGLAKLPRGDRRIWAALACAAVWAVHPIHTQAVSYIVQRQTVMASALSLLALLLYITARQRKDKLQAIALYLLAALSFIIAAGSKEIALVTPVLAFCYELYFFRNLDLSFFRKRPLLILPLIVIVALPAVFMLRPSMLAGLLSGYDAYPFGLIERLLTEPRVIMQYVGLILLPLPSRLVLEHQVEVSVSLFEPWTTLPAIAILTFATVGVVYFARSKPLLSFAGLWFLLNLVMESSFLPLDLMNEHRLYLASLAVICPLIALVIYKTPRLDLALGATAVLVLLLLAGTIARNMVWQSPESLWADCISKSPKLPRPWNNLCAVLNQEQRYMEALPVCEQTINLDSNLPAPYNNMGIALYQTGRHKHALEQFKLAISKDPKYLEAHFNMGELLRQNGNIEGAIEQYSRTLELDPLHYRAYLSRARSYVEMEKHGLAIPDYRTFVQLRPRDPHGYLMLAGTLTNQGKFDEALLIVRQGLGLIPGNPQLKQWEEHIIQMMEIWKRE